MLTPLVERFHAGDRLALSRLLSWVSRGENVEQILAAVGPPKTPARVVALTGSGADLLRDPEVGRLYLGAGAARPAPPLASSVPSPQGDRTPQD